MMINDNHALNPSVFKNIPYDSVKDFAPIGFVGYTPLILAAQSVRPGEGREGAGRARQDEAGRRHLCVGRRRQREPHLAGEMLGTAAGVKLLHVPYRGGAPAMNDLIAGHVNTLFLSPVIGLPTCRPAS